jgi:hypothetical protein
MTGRAERDPAEVYGKQTSTVRLNGEVIFAAEVHGFG